jgi:hypothetical protein
MSDEMDFTPENPDVQDNQTTLPDNPEDQEETLASVDVIAGETKITLSTPVKEFEAFKESFKNMMYAFTEFIEATGMEIGKDETKEQVNELVMAVAAMKENEEKLQENTVTRDEYEADKAEAEEKEAQAREDFVRRSEFEKFRQQIRDAI